MSLEGAEVESWKYLAVCVPIVVFFAPLGSYVSSHFHRQVLAVLIYVLDTIALVSTGKPKPKDTMERDTHPWHFISGDRPRRPAHDPLAVARVCRTHFWWIRILLGHLEAGRKNPRGQSGPPADPPGTRPQRRRDVAPIKGQMLYPPCAFRDTS